MDGQSAGLHAGQRLAAVSGIQHRVAVPFQGLVDVLADAWLVLRQQDGFGAPQVHRQSGRLSGQEAGFDRGEKHAEHATLSRGAVGPNGAATLLDDAVDGGKTESSALPFFLGGEKGFEDVRLRFRVHAGATIVDGKLDVSAGFHQRMAGGVGLIEVGVARFDDQFAAVGHGVA